MSVIHEKGKPRVIEGRKATDPAVGGIAGLPNEWLTHSTHRIEKKRFPPPAEAAFLLTPAMSETALALLLLGVISACAVVCTIVLFLTARDLRRTLHRTHTLLSLAEGIVRDARRVVHVVEGTVQDACDVAEHFIEPLRHWQQRAQRFFLRSHHNGAGAGPRRHH